MQVKFATFWPKYDGDECWGSCDCDPSDVQVGQEVTQVGQHWQIFHAKIREEEKLLGGQAEYGQGEGEW